MNQTLRPSVIAVIFCIVSAYTAAQPVRRQPPQNTWDQFGLKVTQQVPEFGGFWYENGRLVIGLTRLNTRAKANSKLIILAVLKRREAETGPVIYRKVEHDFKSIHTARVRIRSLLKERKISSLDSDEQANVVRVGVIKQSDIPDVLAKVRALGIPDALVRIEQRAPTVYDSDISDLRNRVRPLMGGIQIWRGGRCTLGVVGRRNGVRGILTNSHCTQVLGHVDGSEFFQFDGRNNDARPLATDRVGVEVADSPVFRSSYDDNCPDGYPCQYADAAFIQLDDNIMARRGWIMEPTSDYFGDTLNYEIAGISPIGVCGMKIFKVGRTTGETSGEVDGTCEDHLGAFPGQDPDEGTYKLCQDTNTADAGGGDSGSPVLERMIDQTKARFYGLHWGSVEGESSRVSPYYLIASQLGAIDVMPGNDPPRVRITTPQHGAAFGMNPLSDKVRFEASIFDPEDERCGMNTSDCTVTWTSNKDGVIGTGRTAEFIFRTAGLHTITATAKDGSQTAADSIGISVSSTPPNITVVQPTGPFYRGLPYVLYATATDSDIVLLQRLECNRFTWTSSLQADLGTGPRLPEDFCEVIHTFNTLGNRNLIVEARDAQGDKNSKSIPVNVLPRPLTGPPIINLLITNRVTGSNPNSLYHLRASIWDPDGGERAAYKWTVEYGNTKKTIKHKQAAGRAQISDPWRPSDHVPSKCGGWPVTLTLEATDDQGQTSEASLRLHVPYPLC